MDLHGRSLLTANDLLGRMFDGIEYRGFDQETVETLAAYAAVPVWNGRTDAWNPTRCWPTF